MANKWQTRAGLSRLACLCTAALPLIFLRGVQLAAQTECSVGHRGRLDRGTGAPTGVQDPPSLPCLMQRTWLTLPHLTLRPAPMHPFGAKRRRRKKL